MQKYGYGENFYSGELHLAERIRKRKNEVLSRIRTDLERFFKYNEEAFRYSSGEILSMLREIFNDEEDLMIHTRYPDYEKQFAAHRYFLSHIFSYFDTLQFNHENAFHVLSFIRDWLENHIRISDSEFNAWLLRAAGKRHRTAACDDLREIHPELLLSTTKYLLDSQTSGTSIAGAWQEMNLKNRKVV